MKKVLIFNAVPFNNGDAALVFSLYKIFESQGFEVKIASFDFDYAKSTYKNYPIIRELTDYKILSKIPLSKYVKSFLTPFMFIFSKQYKSNDLFVACPGGFMNSYYGFLRVGLTFISAKLYGKKTAIYSQSIGPLTKTDKILFKFFSKFIDLIYARDSFSFSLLDNLKIDKKKFKKVEDAAFLIPFENVPSTNRTIAISVREWKHDSRDQNLYIQNIKVIVNEIVKRGFNVEFLSTCQGFENYIDDSNFALKIYDLIEDPILKKQIEVNRNFYDLHDFMTYIGKFHAVIGTRLHMCILSMLKGKPSFNISYEVKGKEVYNYLELDEFSIDYNENIFETKIKIINFLNNLDSLYDKLDLMMPNQNLKAKKYFDEFIEILSNEK